MARGDFYYLPLPKEMNASLDYIINRDAKKYGVMDKRDLVRMVVGEFIAKYEETHNTITAVHSLKGDEFKKKQRRSILNQP